MQLTYLHITDAPECKAENQFLYVEEESTNKCTCLELATQAALTWADARQVCMQKGQQLLTVRCVLMFP